MFLFNQKKFNWITFSFIYFSIMTTGMFAQARPVNNPLLDTDSYKVSHWNQYPEGTEEIFGYLESRGGKFDRTVFFGLQYILKEYFSTPITQAMVEEAKEFYKQHFGNDQLFNYEGWSKVVSKHGGKLPIRIRAVAEGSVIPTSQVLMTVESTDPELYWVPSWFETQLMRVWYPINVATISYHAKLTIKNYLDLTADNTAAEIGFKLHDFGARGVSSAESAGIGGAAHLVNFMGSDTVQGIIFAQQYYNSSSMPAFSIPAAEHSTITSWGRENEVEAYRNMLTKFAKPGSIVAVVSDSYDLFNAIDTLWGKVLKDQIIKSGSTVVIRPDSGDPVTVVLKSLELMDANFGASVNSKGFKVINHNVRLIQGDGVDLGSIQDILAAMATKGFSASNIAFGMGGGLLQKHDRDTQKFAYKTSSIRVSGEYRDVYKDPVTDHGKRSKAGKLDLVIRGSSYQTVKIPGAGYDYTAHGSLLPVVYEDGVLLRNQTLEEIRAMTSGTMGL